jgi:hypothetical protein
MLLFILISLFPAQANCLANMVYGIKYTNTNHQRYDDK